LVDTGDVIVHGIFQAAVPTIQAVHSGKAAYGVGRREPQLQGALR
jgi:hypothetical protein